MKHELPIILGAGLFDSKKFFKEISVTKPRLVKVFELEYFFEDGGTSIINDIEYPIRAGNILFSKPDDIRYSKLHFKSMFLHFDIGDPVLKSAIDGIPPVFPADNPKRIEAMFSSITADSYSVNRFDNIAASATLITLLHRVCGIQNTDVSIISSAQKFIEIHYKEDISATQIADACGISTPYLYKLFKNALNTTPGEYLLSHRISAARELLVNTEISLGRIAFECGFNSQSYFSDRFRKSVGVSPKEYRKNAAYSL